MGTQLPPKTGTPPIFGQCVLWPNCCVDQDTTWYGGRPRPRRLCTKWGPSCPLKGSQLPIFGPCLLWPKSRPSQLHGALFFSCCTFAGRVDPLRRHQYQPESKTVADNASVNIVEVVLADCSPISRVIHFQTSLAACSSRQPDTDT